MYIYDILDIMINIFLYEHDTFSQTCKLHNILKNILYLHSKNGSGYNVNIINNKNINKYLKNIPDNFNSLSYDEKKEYIKYNVLHEYGGVWLNNNLLILGCLDRLFDIFNICDSFFIGDATNEITIKDGIFGCKKHIKTSSNDITIKDGIFGNKLLSSNNNIKLIDINTFIYELSFDNHNTGNYQYEVRDIIHITNNKLFININNKVFNDTYYYDIEYFFNKTSTLSLFICSSFEKMKLIDYDFIEIGTSNFDTMIEQANNNEIGISVEPIKYYIDLLPNKPNVKKINVGISDNNTKLNIYYIPENIINERKIPFWFKGCNSINDFHPLHKQYNYTHLCKIEKVDVITACELFYQNSVKKLKFLKIDTEGHDCIILKSLFEYIRYLPKYFYPNKIMFESNENILKKNVDDIIELYINIGYILYSRNSDTILIHNE